MAFDPPAEPWRRGEYFDDRLERIGAPRNRAVVGAPVIDLRIVVPAPLIDQRVHLREPAFRRSTIFIMSA